MILYKEDMMKKNKIILIVFLILILQNLCSASNVKPLYSIKKTLLPKFQPQIYLIKDKPVTRLFDVPVDNAVAIEKQSETHAISLVLFNDKTSDIKYKEIIKGSKHLSGKGKKTYLPIFSGKAIGYFDAEHFYILNLKTGEQSQTRITTNFKYKIHNIEVVNEEKNIFLFHILNLESDDNNLIRIVKYDSDFKNFKISGEKAVDSSTLVESSKNIIFFIKNNIVKMLDINLRETDHPFINKLNQEKAKFGNVTEIKIHPYLPFAIFNDTAKNTTWLISWRNKNKPELHKIFNDGNTLGYNFSYDGKWLHFQTYTDYFLMRINKAYPVFISHPIFLETIPFSLSPEQRAAMMMNPPGFVLFEHNHTGGRLFKCWSFAKAANLFELADMIDPLTCKINKNKYNKIIKPLKKAIEHNPNDIAPCFNIGLLYRKQGEYDKAVKSFNKVLQLNPSYIPAYVNRGMIFNLQGRKNKAKQDFNKIKQLNKSVEFFYLGLFAEKDYADHWDKINKFRDTASILAALGVLSSGTEYNDKAFDYYTKAIKLNPKYAAALFRRGLIGLSRNVFYDGSNIYDKCMKDFNRAHKYDESIRVKRYIAFAYYLRGESQIKRGYRNSGLKDFLKAVKLDKNLKANDNYASAFLQRGKELFSHNKYTKAIEYFTKCIQGRPKSCSAYFYRSKSWGRLGRHDKAIDDINKAISFDCKSARIYNRRGNIHKILNQYDLAIEDYNKAIEIDPEYVIAYNNKAWLYATAGNKQYRNGRKAVAFALKAVKLARGRESYYLDTLGAAYVENRQYNKAVEAYGKVIKKEPTYWIKRYQKILKEKGYYSGAIDGIAGKRFKKALKKYIKDGNYL